MTGIRIQVWDVVGMRSSPRKVQACHVWFNWSQHDPLISFPPPQCLHRVPGTELLIRPDFERAIRRARWRTCRTVCPLIKWMRSRPTTWRLYQAQAQAKKLNREKPRFLSELWWPHSSASPPNLGFRHERLCLWKK
jgi:hypothetical protein